MKYLKWKPHKETYSHPNPFILEISSGWGVPRGFPLGTYGGWYLQKVHSFILALTTRGAGSFLHMSQDNKRWRNERNMVAFGTQERE